MDEIVVLPFEIYAYLKTRGFKLYSHEESECSLESLVYEERNNLKQAMIRFLNRANFSTVTYLLSRSRILQSDPRHFENIKQLYQELAAISEILTILQVLEYSGKSLDIIFDFDNDNIQDISPTHGDSGGSRDRREK